MAKLDPVCKISKSGLKVTLRSPLAGEGEQVLNMVREIIGRSDHLLTRIEEFTYTVEQENELIRSHLEHPDKIMIIPEVEGRIVGMLNFSTGHRKRNSHSGEFGVSLLPEFRGKGVGELLVQALMDWAREHPEVEALRLRVHARNENALSLYRKLGFREEGREIRGAKLGPEDYDDVISMALDTSHP